MNSVIEPMLCRLPPPLQPGDRLVAIAPSGTLREQERFLQGVDLWRQRGYVIDLAKGYDNRWGYLAGTDAQRRQQLDDAWSDPLCRGILCVRGGYGGARLLEDWQWPRIEGTGATAAKWLIGFSDVTALLWSLANQGVAGLHGPVLTTLAEEPTWSLARLWDWVEGRGPLAPLQGVGWGGGRVQGRLLPGNLTVATHLLHTDDQPNLQGVILALEDVGEAPYRIDRMLTQWRRSGALARVAGIALGRFSSCAPPAQVPSFSVDEVLRDRLGDLEMPVVAELPFGHEGVNAVLPVGIPAILDGEAGTLVV